jgi:hypothetical protein
MRRSKTPQFKDLESSIIHAPSTTETTMQGVLAALPPTRYPPSHDGEGPSRSLPKGELLCVGRNLGLCVLALCFAFVALR